MQTINRPDFIAQVLACVRQLIARYEPDDPALFRKQLDGILLDLNRRDMIHLVRADLIPVMDFNLVKRSETDAHESNVPFRHAGLKPTEKRSSFALT